MSWESAFPPLSVAKAVLILVFDALKYPSNFPRYLVKRELIPILL